MSELVLMSILRFRIRRWPHDSNTTLNRLAVAAVDLHRLRFDSIGCGLGDLGMNSNCYSPERKKPVSESSQQAQHYKRKEGVKDRYSNAANEREKKR